MIDIRAIQEEFINQGFQFREQIFNDGDCIIEATLCKNIHHFGDFGLDTCSIRTIRWGKYQRDVAWEMGAKFFGFSVIKIPTDKSMEIKLSGSIFRVLSFRLNQPSISPNKIIKDFIKERFNLDLFGDYNFDLVIDHNNSIKLKIKGK